MFAQHYEQMYTKWLSEIFLSVFIDLSLEANLSDRFLWIAVIP
jgi:hypothetical protein